MRKYQKQGVQIWLIIFRSAACLFQGQTFLSTLLFLFHHHHYQAIHSKARTTHLIREEIRNSTLSQWKLAERYNRSLPQMPDETERRYLFVAIGRTTRWVFVKIYADQLDSTSTDFLIKVNNAGSMPFCMELDARSDTG